MSSSGCPDSNNRPVRRFQVCLIGESLKENDLLIRSIKKFGFPIVQSSNGLEYIYQDTEFFTIYILDEFEGEVYNTLHKAGQRILGPTALIHYAEKNEQLPNNSRPLYTASMKNVVIAFTGFRVKEELVEMVTLIHHMGGRVRKNFIVSKTTHVIANTTFGEKCKYAAGFGTPIMTSQWVYKVWERRHDPSCIATNAEFIPCIMLPFADCKIALLGYQADKEQDMIEVLSRNGGEVVNPNDSSCTHIVVEDGHSVTASDYRQDIYIVENEWFQACIDLEAKADESIYKFGNPSTTSSSQVLPAIGNRYDRLVNDFDQLYREFLRLQERVSLVLNRSGG